MILDAIAEAIASGARQAAACSLIGISSRTVERWQSMPGREDRRCGPRRQPSNALSASEKAKVVAVMTSPCCAGMSPKQLVPHLADEGRYLASESTMYRLRRQLGLGARRRGPARTQVTRATTVHSAAR